VREQELHGKVVNLTAFEVFAGLLEWESEWEKSLKSKYTLADFFFYYIPVLGEVAADVPSHPGRVHGAIRRPKNPPVTTAVPGCRSNFCFRVVGTDKLAIRELSCRCAPCLDHDWGNCKNESEVGSWTTILMESHPSSESAPVRTRNQSRLVSDQRRSLARQCPVGDYLAMESADDAEGFEFWLGLVTTACWKQQITVTSKGKKLVAGHYYIGVQMFDRFPATCPSTFRQDTESPLIIDAEGVVALKVQVAQLGPTRPPRSAGVRRRNSPSVFIQPPRPQPTIISISNSEVARLTSACSTPLGSKS
jgi:hypothetical protein